MKKPKKPTKKERHAVALAGLQRSLDYARSERRKAQDDATKAEIGQLQRLLGIRERELHELHDRIAASALHEPREPRGPRDPMWPR